MAKLTATQTAILTAAAQRLDGNIEPLPENVNPGVRPRVIQGLLSRQWIVPVNDGYAISATGCEAIGVEPTSATRELARKQTKQEKVITLLKRENGATLAELCDATGWQQHTVRGMFASTLKKRLGLTMDSNKAPGEHRRYRIIESEDINA